MTQVESNQNPDSARIAKLDYWMGRRSPIRRWLQRRKANQESAPAWELLDALESCKYLRYISRARGFFALSEIELSVTEQELANKMLIQALKPPNTAASSIRVASTCGSVGVFCIAGLSAIALLFSREAGEVAAGAALLVLCSAPVAALIINDWLVKSVRIAALTAAARHARPDALDVLYHHYADDVSVKGKARTAVLEVLNRVDKSWYGELPSDSKTALTQLIFASDTSVAISALDALQRAGDGSAVTEVESLARRGRIKLVRERAAEVLPVLLERKAREAASATLLRASDSSDEAHLLRAAGATTTPASELLRVQSGSSEPEMTAQRK